MKEVLTVEEIVALLKKFPLGFSSTTYWRQKDEWFKEFKPKLEAFLAQCVGRAHLQKLHDSFPKMPTKNCRDSQSDMWYYDGDELDEFFKKLNEWKEKRLEAVTGK